MRDQSYPLRMTQGGLEEMFNVYLNNGEQIPDEQACYIIAKDGIYLKKNLGIIESVIKVNKISFLEALKEQAQLNINKLPAKSCGQIQKFFKDICIKYHGSEAIVLLYYNQKTGNYRIIAPTQIVSGGTCDFSREESLAIEGYNLIGDIHSHGSGSAFHSGTDDIDEKTGVDGLHITFGSVSENDISISASITVNGKRFYVEPNEYLEGCLCKSNKEIQNETRIFKLIDEKLVEQLSENSINSNGYFHKRYVFDVSEEEREYPEEWLTNVVYRADLARTTNYAIQKKPFEHWWPNRETFSHWRHFETWEDYFDNQYGVATNPLNVGPASKNIFGEGYVCERCPYKRKALQIETGIDDSQNFNSSKDDRIPLKDKDIYDTVEEQLTHEDFLNTPQAPQDKDQIEDNNSDKIPKNLKGKPKSRLQKFWESF